MHETVGGEMRHGAEWKRRRRWVQGFISGIQGHFFRKILQLNLNIHLYDRRQGCFLHLSA